MKALDMPQPKLSKFLFTDTRLSLLWLVIRVYIGYEWLMAGWAKLMSPAWTGEMAGTAVKGFLNGALNKTTGEHPDVSAWYAYFIQNIALPHSTVFSYLVTYGEILVGAALILGIFTGIAAFFGTFMNFNYLFAGTVSSNPFMLFLQLFLILAWRTSGWLGLDRYALPKLSSIRPGKLFNKKS